MPEVIVVGAGVSGLALAWQLRRRGVRARVLEAADRPGGKIRSQSSDGFLCEWGPAGFSTHAPAVRELVSALGLEKKLLPAAGTRRRGVRVGRAALAVPHSLGGLVASRLLSPTEKLRVLADLIRRPEQAGDGTNPDDESLAELAERHLGRAGAERLLYPLLPGAYALDPRQTSASAAFPWLAGAASERGSLLRSTTEIVNRGDATLASFEGGMEELPRALAAALGPDLHLSTSVDRLAAQRGGFRLSLSASGAALELNADAVILALPAHRAREVAAPLDEAVAGILASIPYVPVTLVFLGLASPVGGRLAGHGYYVPAGHASPLAGAVYASSLFSGRAPRGRSLVAARFGGARHPELAALPDEALVGLARNELTAIVGAKAQSQLLGVVRHPQALPQYALGHRERLAAVATAERRHPGLFFAGNAYRGLGVADCLRDAAAVAERVVVYCNARAGEPGKAMPPAT
jgi:oxygen-dependent protoporphyrinogen oxidase